MTRIPGRRRCAIYLRVSSDRQTVENQRADLERLCEARGWEPVIFEETESAAKERPILAGLMVRARAGEFAAVAVWALDRLHRSMPATIATVLELDRCGVAVVSVRDAWLDTAGPVRSLLVAIFGWVAEQERARLIERTHAGLERARKQGTRLGRPRASSSALAAAADAHEAGASVKAAAEKYGVSESTLRRHLKERGQE